MPINKISSISDAQKGWKWFSYNKKLKVLDKLIALQKKGKIS